MKNQTNKHIIVTKIPWEIEDKTNRKPFGCDSVQTGRSMWSRDVSLESSWSKDGHRAFMTSFYTQAVILGTHLINITVVHV